MRNVFWIFIFIFSQPVLAQIYSPDYARAKVEIADSQLSGYTTRFDVEEKMVRRGLWQYSKSFAKLDNLKQYYVINIPASENEGNMDVVLFAKTLPNESETEFSLVLDREGLPENEIGKFEKQTEALLVDFKKHFYVELYQDKIDDLTKKSSKAGKRYERMLRKEKDETESVGLLNEIQSLEKQIQAIRKKQFRVLN